VSTETSFAWALVSLYAAAVVWMAVRGRRSSRSMAAFSVGTRTVSPVFVGLSLAANLTSAATFVINPGLIYLYGWSGVLGYAVAAPLGIFLGLVVFSKSFRRVGDRFTVLTVPQWIGDRFGDRRLKVWFALLSLLQVSFLVLIVVGITLVLANILQVPVPVALVATVAFTFAYILLGGATTHIMTNSIQAGIMIVVAVIFLASGARFFAGGPGAFMDRLAGVGPYYAGVVNPRSLLFRNLFEVFAANFVVGVAIILQPHVIVKALYLRTERDVNRYLTIAIVVATLFFAVLLTGLFARLTLHDPSLPPDRVMATYIVSHFAPPIRALIGLGILAAGFSTLEGILVALSSIFANDFLATVAPAHTADHTRDRSLRAARLFLVVLAPVTLLLSRQQILHPSLSVAIFAQNGVYGLFSATFVPVLFGVFSRTMARGWIFGASAAALAVHFGIVYSRTPPPPPPPPGPPPAPLASGLLVMAVGVALGRVRAAVPAPGASGS
jgi:sodium/pantothenate symporter